MSTTMLSNVSYQRKRIAAQVQKIHILILALILVLVSAATAIIVNAITSSVSENIADFYSSEAIGKFNSYVNQELVLVEKASRSSNIIDWFSDEGNTAKKTIAYKEMIDYIAILKDVKLYIGVHKSLDEYFISGLTTLSDNFLPIGRLDPSETVNDWYFECVKSGYDHVFNVDIDKATEMQHVWINHKVKEDDILVGVLCFGLPYDEMAKEVFARYDNKKVKGYIIDKHGVIQMDSAHSGIYYQGENADQKSRIHTLNKDPLFHSAIDVYLDEIDGYLGLPTETKVIKLGKGSKSYISIVPIAHTDWSVVTFFSNDSLFTITNLLPLLIAVLSAFLVYVVFDTICMQHYVFKPLNNLTKSLTASNFYISDIFGCDRDDEIGVLAQTIQKMRDRLSTYNAELLRAARERERLIRIDQLTDIPNRRSFDERLPLEWGRAIRVKTPISILILDLDHFKDYNDTYGHLQGDRALQTIAKMFMQELKRSGDIVARWGGEEFAVLLSNTDFEGAVEVAERIREKVAVLPISHVDGSSSKMTVSIGVNSMIPTINYLLEDFIHNADMALYNAKREGRNRVCRYNGVVS
jgi:diguanylate cyclase (GGDEF)-like protein